MPRLRISFLILAGTAMCQFDTPNFVYYSYIVVIILTLITGFSVLCKDPKHPLNRNAFYFILIIALWTFDDLLQWVIRDSFWNMFFTRVSYLAEFIVPFFLIFVYHFTYTRINLRKKLLILIPYIILALLACTKLAFRYFDVGTCDFTSGLLMYYLFSLDIVYAIWATRILVKYRRDPIIPLVSRKQSKVLIFAIWFFVLWSIIYEGIGMSDLGIDISPHFIIGNLFFVSLIAFAIIKKKLFEFRLVPLDWFVASLWTLLFAGMLFFAGTPFVFALCAVAYVALMTLFFRM